MTDASPSKRPSVSVVIATAFREDTLRTTLRALAAQQRPPDEIIVVDGAPAPGVESMVADHRDRCQQSILYLRSTRPGAAVQRNLGIDNASGDVLVFLDDDAYLEADCLEKMVGALEDDAAARIGGVGVIIRNQPCHAPSRLAKRWFDLLADEWRPSYSGMVIGPAIAIGPEPTAEPDLVRVEWLMSTCVAYRRAALPDGGFNARFAGYSYMEDVDLSLRVARQFDLVVHTGACIFHDSRPSRFKAPYVLAKMIVENRYYVMTVTLGRTTLGHHARFMVSLFVPLVMNLRGVRSGADLAAWLRSCGGTLSGLMATCGAALKRGGVATEARVGL
jgi:GT2 family glycosyltransferase